MENNQSDFPIENFELSNNSIKKGEEKEKYV